MREDTLKKNSQPPHCKRGSGPSSYWMQDPKSVFDLLNIKSGQHILDLGCGAGDYTLEAARRTGSSGCVTAVDHWPPIVTAVEAAARGAGLGQVRALKADITRPPIPVLENTVDLCMVFTVLHIFGQDRFRDAVAGELARVIKPGACLAVLECKKEEWSFGPPVHMRLAPHEVEASVRNHGFIQKACQDLGYNYLMIFELDP